MKIYISFLLLILFSSSNMHADVKYYESLDPFTDEEIFYAYGESVNNEFFTLPAYFKIMYSEEEEDYVYAFNSEYFSFQFDEFETVEMQYRFDKEKMGTLDLYFCSVMEETQEYCRVKQSERDPSLGYFAFDLDNDSSFFFDMFNWDVDPPVARKKLLIRFPGEEPIEFNLKGAFNALYKLDQKVGSLQE